MKKILLCICLSTICILLSACVTHEVERKNTIQDKAKEEQEKTKKQQDKTKEKKTSSNKKEPQKDEPQGNTNSTLYGIEIGEKIIVDMKQSDQENSFYCGPAVVQMVLDHFLISKTQKELADEMNTVAITGTEYVDMARILNRYIFQKEQVLGSESGYRVQTLNISETNPDVLSSIHTQLQQNIQEGYPSILAVNLNTLYPEQVSVNHFVVCNGYILKRNSNEIAFYYIIDPYYEVQDTQYGGVKVFTPEELERAIIENVEPAYIW